ncbi:class II aldolase/adducin family protein [uncultured Sphaerochaeta sp.]|uniref:class II aldolase/adducin family protein n=1 Tax=uncultured Sphaerochaeta sp. TaxID=886478 RepID=UPI002A0A48F0|nr:class II aldolase/adducin family protein [uncultured Sphaerochaeta sp.]
MELQEAKQAVLEATKKLVASQLVARTWGNISCRVGEEHFLITPSGKSYEHLTEDQLVLVSLEGLAYTGSLKPSSEKGIHALVYRTHPQVNCVIHTHQEMASLMSLVGNDLSISDEWRELLGEIIPTSRYGLPGTKALMNQVGRILKGYASPAVLMANHGALCFGSSPQEAFSIAEALEGVCKEQVFRLSPLLSSLNGEVQIRAFARRDGEEVTYTTNDSPSLQAMGNQIMKSKKDCNYILLLTSQEVLEVSERGKTLHAFLDDFAQIAGPSVEIVQEKPTGFHGLKHRDALIVQKVGAFCMGSSESEAHAVATLVQKNSKAALLRLSCAQVKPLPYLDTHLMRYVYKEKYAKLACSSTKSTGSTS